MVCAVLKDANEDAVWGYHLEDTSDRHPGHSARMIFCTKNGLIAEGDTVIFFVSPKDLLPIVAKRDGELRHKLGKFRHNDIIGKEYGTRVASSDGTKRVALLRPTPELWTRALPHRTQIIYLADISFIMQQLNLRDGMTVIESGTGSGSFSHSMARALWPNGKLFTFEFHQSRAQQAKAEFEQHGLLSTVIRIEHRNVCSDGFGVEDQADAVFLDLPSPWEAVPHAYCAMKKTGESRICCFSPCIEQVLKSYEALRASGFTEIKTFECLSKEHEVRALGAGGALLSAVERKRSRKELESMTIVTKPVSEARGHTSYLTFARLPSPVTQ